MTRAIKDTNQDVTGGKCVRDDKKNLTISYKAKLHAWKEHYQRLLNAEFPWDKNFLDNSVAVEGPAIFVTENMVTDVIKKMKQGKAGEPSGVIVEMIKGMKDSFIINCNKEKAMQQIVGTIGDL